MAYERTTWMSGETALSADNMNNIEDGIEELKEDVTRIDDNFFSKEVNVVLAGSDLNTIHETGLYYIGAGVTNSPHDYATMLVISRDGSSGLTTQLLMGSQCYLRIYSGSPLVWGTWYKLN